MHTAMAGDGVANSKTNTGPTAPHMTPHGSCIIQHLTLCVPGSLTAAAQERPLARATLMLISALVRIE